MGNGIDDHVDPAAVLSLTCSLNVHLMLRDSQEVPA
jgi:hypothetical protein